MSIQGLDQFEDAQFKDAIDSGRRFEANDGSGTRIFKNDNYYYYGFSDGRPPMSLNWEDFIMYDDSSRWVEVGGLKLIIKKRFLSQRLSSYHFYIEEEGIGEVLDLFVIPADIDWNDQLKDDIVESILFCYYTHL